MLPTSYPAWLTFMCQEHTHSCNTGHPEISLENRALRIFPKQYRSSSSLVFGLIGLSVREELLLFYSNRCQKTCDRQKFGSAWDGERGRQAGVSPTPSFWDDRLSLRWLCESYCFWTASHCAQHLCGARIAASPWAKGTLLKGTAGKRTCVFRNHFKSAGFQVTQACIKILHETIFEHFTFQSEQRDSQELQYLQGQKVRGREDQRFLVG